MSVTDHDKLLKIFKEYRVEYTDEAAKQLYWEIDNN